MSETQAAVAGDPPPYGWGWPMPYDPRPFPLFTSSVTTTPISEDRIREIIRDELRRDRRRRRRA